MPMKSNTIYIALGIFSKILQMLIVMLITRVVSLEHFGEYELVSAAIVLLFPLLTVGVCDGIFKFCYDSADNLKEIFTRFFAFGFFTLILFSSILISIYGYFYDFVSSIIIFGLICVNFLNEINKQLSKSLGNLVAFGIVELSLNTLFFVSLVLVYFDIINVVDVKGVLTLLLVSNFTVFILSFIALKTGTYIDYPLLLKPRKLRLKPDEFKYSITMMPNTILWWVINASDRYVLYFFMGPISVAIYSVANKFPNLIIAFNRIVMQIWHLKAFSGESNKKHWSTTYITMICCYVIVVPVILFVFDYLFPSEYGSAKLYVPILVLSSIYSGLSSMLGAIFMKSGQVQYALNTTLLSGAVNIVLNLILVPIFGIMGCTVATLISMITLFFSRFRIVRDNFSSEDLGCVSKVYLHIGTLVLSFGFVVTLYLKGGV
ncbi:lipopolysaccharide biosynthesis protein [Vibrio crassostreae]|uniref:lipopolysaccharide biosynthesis protein n=1 Tax=Vibrio crassostreae TaxID=246167 RepID=UPI000F4AD81C|nr:polysaccharide biosynthesis C-terminal domain-containing protein [Vibrio crassostreae]ROQ72044.1 O-antigen/teichoic acid export membrane protein [Vibrio crassostreae]ROR77653.1 O-antigen/teichoic acid export membrane protein [Vibrio crassostreae]RPF12624.1 O-antigen/teichoic acid export membrane protein [Vibrio crassostreae]TQL31088.1 O-antigen/teichoic acid export membrane protein [Vibrio crassostreae]